MSMLNKVSKFAKKVGFKTDKNTEQKDEGERLEEESWRSAFRVVDKNADGLVDSTELKFMYEDLMDTEPKDIIIERVFDQFDKNSDGYIDEQEFVDWMKFRLASKEKYKVLFQKLDKDNNGYISLNEFESAIEDIEPDVTEDQKARIFNDMDKNNDGRIDYQEFMANFL